MLESTPDDFKIDCLECDGEAMIYSECCECGHEKEEECERCDNDGRIAWGDLEEFERRKYLTKQRYAEAVAKDLRAVSDWLSKPFDPMMVDAGFAVWCDIDDRKPRYVFQGVTS